MRSADAKDKAGLQRLESRLSMEEIAHFRAFVAARSSKVLTKSELHLRHAVDAVDAVVANLGALRLSNISLCLWCQYCDPPFPFPFPLPLPSPFPPLSPSYGPHRGEVARGSQQGQPDTCCVA